VISQTASKPSLIPKCFNETSHSCSAESKSSNAGEVANIGSAGTSGKLWKAEKKRSFAGTRLFGKEAGKERRRVRYWRPGVIPKQLAGLGHEILRDMSKLTAI
jgi:hypothetical protein